jgi:hypothetical protein
MGLYLAVAPWIDRAREQRRSIATLSQEIQQLRALLAQRQDLEETLTDLNDRAGKTGYFLEAESPASGGLAMIDSVKSAVRQAGAQWLNAQLLPPIAGQDITLVGIRVHLQGDERALLDMLYQHESDCPMLFVDNLIIRPLQSRRMAEKSEAYQWIDIRFDLQAYMRRD